MKTKTLNKKVALIILDGYGIGPDYEYNAVNNSNSPFLHKHLLSSKTKLEASQEAVGLPHGTMGGSEVGHFTIGAGRIVNQALHRINTEIENKDFYKNTTLVNQLEKKPKAIQLIGMISDAGVHSDIKHIKAILEMVSLHSPYTKVQLHAISDGRDVSPKSVKQYLGYLDQLSQDFPNFITTTLIGRYYAMDRDKNFDRTQKAYDLITKGLENKISSLADGVEYQYSSGLESDYYLEPICLNSYSPPNKEDLFICFNFRTDRAAQISQLISENFKMIIFGDYCNKASNLFPNPVIKNNLGEVLSANNLKQLRIAETEKYAHVTFFFNSQHKTPYPNEEREVVESTKIANYKDKPEMSAENITNTAIKKTRETEYSLVLINYANPDLVGHSGSYQATKESIEFIDRQLSKLVPELLEQNYDILITSDHGNSEFMANKDGSINPSHTTNPVPLCIISNTQIALRQTGGLKDIAPTILELLEIEKPIEMTGNSLIINN